MPVTRTFPSALFRRAGVGCAALLLVSACSSGTKTDDGAVGAATGRSEVTRADVDRAIEQIQPRIEALLAETEVPGLAIGVVHDDELVWFAGYGTKDVNTGEPIDEHTVFQMASVSKPIGATVIARLVGEETVEWDTPVHANLPSFVLSDPWVTEHVTIADLYSHRSGLPDHAGDDLEWLGFDRAAIIERLRYQPLEGFRDTYAYTNYGLTAAAEAAVAPTGLSWEDASEQLLYEPAGMTSTSSRFDDYINAANRAVPHTPRDDGTWATDFVQEPDSESPAGGVSSTVHDLARFVRLQIGAGELDGEQIVDSDALTATHMPHIVSGWPETPTAKTPQYGLGWNVGVDNEGNVTWNHSGAFSLGAATVVSIVPQQKLGVIVLSNALPIGVVETVSAEFLDYAVAGEQTRDWWKIYREAFEHVLAPVPDFDITKPAATPARAASAYVGSYANAYLGDVVVKETPSGLVMVMGPAQVEFELTHLDGDTYWFIPPGEFGVAPEKAVFDVGTGSNATALTLGFFAGGPLTKV